MSGRSSNSADNQITPLGRAIDDFLERKTVNLNAKEFANEIGVHPSTITKLRRGGFDLAEPLFNKMVEKYPEIYNIIHIFVGKINKVEVEDKKEFEYDDEGFPIKGVVKIDFDKARNTVSFSDGSHPKYIRRVLEELADSDKFWTRLEN